ncbi:Ca2+-binding protein, EF-hand superfamily [Nannocystis exedens]|uniref:Ca2+-binding protein, EF-hand superfamily n=1 Tax=Nannocystis exedens TaxID=54 RepID=A0A1I2A4W8_9BACT|nr:EF-hand domain-containing protein [Nannocystis exedens]PCC69653.1 transaldolase/EF-hand domain-containing protein [Nannocystis exedens]SFE39164.1 Ca2+-binding protein, EF-hand superfamily [Nannocystis exedens]
MTRITKAAFLSLSLLFVACDKEETEEPAEQELAAVEGGHHKGGFMAKFDADGDGALSREEVKGHRFEAKFAELDADGDGKLTREELKAIKGHRGRGGHKDPEERANKLLAKFDANSDGALSRDEVTAGPLAEKFAEADADSDGKLSRDELKALKGRGKHGGGPKDPAERAAMMMAKLDVNSDNALTADEVAGHHKLAEKFAEADNNSDGKLSREELVAFKQAHHGDKHRGPRGE